MNLEREQSVSAERRRCIRRLRRAGPGTSAVRSTQYGGALASCPILPAPTIFPDVPHFNPPDFTKPVLAAAPDARFVPAPADGVLPEGFFSTTNSILTGSYRDGGEMTENKRAG